MTLCVYRRGNLPWLYYGDEPGLANRVLQTEPIPIGFSFRGKRKVRRLIQLNLFQLVPT